MGRLPLTTMRTLLTRLVLSVVLTVSGWTGAFAATGAPFAAQTFQGVSSPQSLSSLAAWYDISDVSSLRNAAGAVPSTGGAIKLVGDKSGNSSVNVLALNGVAGNNASAGNAAALQILTGIRITASIALDNWSALNQYMVSRRAGATGEYFLRTDSSTPGRLGLVWYNGSTQYGAVSTASVPFSNYQIGYVRATKSASSAGSVTAKFYTSTDGVSWSQLGSDVVVTAPDATTTTNVLAVGAETTVATTMTGRIYRATIENGYDGAGSVVFDANFATAAKLATSFTESSSNAATVTINTSGATGARISGARDLYQGTAANQPVYLPWSGTNYGYLNGVSGNYFSTPDSATADFTTSLEIITRVSLSDWSGAVTQAIVGKWTGVGNQKSFAFEFLTNGRPNFGFTTDGSTDQNRQATTTPPLVDGTVYWIRCTFTGDNGAAGHDVSFYYQADTGRNTPPSSGWTQIGTTVTTAGTRSLFVGTALPAFGAIQSGGVEMISGRVFYGELRATVGGTAALLFDPSAYASGTTFTASTGEVWTLNGGANIVNSTRLYFDGSNDYLKAAAFSLSQPETVYFVGSQVTWTSLDYFFDGNTLNSMQVSQSGVSPAMGAYAGAGGVPNSSLALATNGIVSPVYNGASGSIRVNRLNAVTGNVGTNNANGFILGVRGDAAIGFANITAQEVVIYSVAHTTAQQDSVIGYLARHWGIAGGFAHQPPPNIIPFEPNLIPWKREDELIAA